MIASEQWTGYDDHFGFYFHCSGNETHDEMTVGGLKNGAAARIALAQHNRDYAH